MYLNFLLQERGFSLEESNPEHNYTYDKNDSFKSINKYIKYELLDNLINN